MRAMTALPQARAQLPVRRPDWAIRLARADDLDRLLALENACFEHDRLSRRSFRRFLTSETATCLVAERAGELAGYALVLYHGRTALARLYSMAVAPEQQGQGLGRALLEAAEAALDQGTAVMRLEVHPAQFRRDRAVSPRRLSRVRRVPRLLRGRQRRAAHAARPGAAPAAGRLGVPHYRQTLEFTCGPAALMMAMKALNRRLRLDRRLELSLWRESTTIFMTSGHGGCSPHGMALAAWRRGLRSSCSSTTRARRSSTRCAPPTRKR